MATVALRVGQPLEQRAVRADDQPAVLQRRRRRDGAGLADRGLGRERRLEVVRHRQPLGDEARLEGHDRPAGVQRRRGPRPRSEPVGRVTGRTIAARSPGMRPWAPSTRVAAAAGGDRGLQRATAATRRSRRPRVVGEHGPGTRPRTRRPAPVVSTAGGLRRDVLAARSPPTVTAVAPSASVTTRRSTGERRSSADRLVAVEDHDVGLERLGDAPPPRRRHRGRPARSRRASDGVRRRAVPPWPGSGVRLEEHVPGADTQSASVERRHRATAAANGCAGSASSARRPRHRAPRPPRLPRRGWPDLDPFRGEASRSRRAGGIVRDGAHELGPPTPRRASRTARLAPCPPGWSAIGGGHVGAAVDRLRRAPRGRPAAHRR